MSQRCNLEIGCEENGVCYAEAHQLGHKCGKVPGVRHGGWQLPTQAELAGVKSEGLNAALMQGGSQLLDAITSEQDDEDEDLYILALNKVIARLKQDSVGCRGGEGLGFARCIQIVEGMLDE